jgi:hypothetical protein
LGALLLRIEGATVLVKPIEAKREIKSNLRADYTQFVQELKAKQ